MNISSNKCKSIMSSTESKLFYSKLIIVGSSNKNKKPSNCWDDFTIHPSIKETENHLSRVRKLKEIVSDSELRQMKKDIWSKFNNTIVS